MHIKSLIPNKIHTKLPTSKIQGKKDSTSKPNSSSDLNKSTNISSPKKSTNKKSRKRDKLKSIFTLKSRKKPPSIVSRNSNLKTPIKDQYNAKVGSAHVTKTSPSIPVESLNAAIRNVVSNNSESRLLPYKTSNNAYNSTQDTRLLSLRVLVAHFAEALFLSIFTICHFVVEESNKNKNAVKNNEIDKDKIE